MNGGLEITLLLAAAMSCEGDTSDRHIRRDGRLWATAKCNGDRIDIRVDGALAYTIARVGAAWHVRDRSGALVATID